MEIKKLLFKQNVRKKQNKTQRTIRNIKEYLKRSLAYGIKRGKFRRVVFESLIYKLNDISECAKVINSPENKTKHRDQGGKK